MDVNVLPSINKGFLIKGLYTVTSQTIADTDTVSICTAFIS